MSGRNVSTICCQYVIIHHDDDDDLATINQIKGFSLSERAVTLVLVSFIFSVQNDLYLYASCVCVCV